MGKSRGEWRGRQDVDSFLVQFKFRQLCWPLSAHIPRGIRSHVHSLDKMTRISHFPPVTHLQQITSLQTPSNVGWQTSFILTRTKHLRALTLRYRVTAFFETQRNTLYSRDSTQAVSIELDIGPLYNFYNVAYRYLVDSMNVIFLDVSHF